VPVVARPGDPRQSAPQPDLRMALLLPLLGAAGRPGVCSATRAASHVSHSLPTGHAADFGKASTMTC
jgi:hypothetical protein